MFSFFSKKKKEPDVEKPVCKIEFSADNDGVIWIDCYWNVDDNPQAHIMLADLMHRVFSGSMTEETLQFIRNQCLEGGQDKELEEFMANLAGFEQDYLNKIMADKLLGFKIKDAKGPVVKPTNVLGGDIRNKKM